MRVLVTDHGTRQAYHLYTYLSGPHCYASYHRQQATIFLNGLRARDTIGGMVKITVPVQGGNIDEAKHLAHLAAVRIMQTVMTALKLRVADQG